LGVESQIGLAILRELGSAGVRVIAIAHTNSAIGLWSNYTWKRVVVGPPRSEAVLAAIRSIGDEFGPCSLITVSESNLLWLSVHREALGCVVPAIPPADALALVLNKDLTLQAAAAVGLRVPRTAAPTSFGEIERLADEFPFPAVLKWSDPNSIAPQLAAEGLELLKSEYIYDGSELLEASKRYRAIDQWPLVQQYCPGRGLGQFFFMHSGHALRRFQHIRIAEWPPEGGFSSVCDAVPLESHVDLQELSIALLRKLGWEGVAMVEFRFDETTGQAYLMEINGRFWGSFPLATHSGAKFALLAHCAAIGAPFPSLALPRDDLRCRMVATEVKRLARIFFSPSRIRDRSFKVRPLTELARFIADFFRPNVRYYVWKFMDPMPFVVDLINWMVKRRST
jgi:predicted ATP-grasp superfamily ATP-dependent carboligase